MNFRSFKYARNSHKITGFVCAVFFLILSVTGVLLMHHDELGLNEVEISGEYLPDKYFKVVSAEPEIQAIAVSADPSPALFVGTPEGLYKSKDGGVTWEQLRRGLMNEDIRAVAINPHDPLIVYAGTAKGIFKSEDGGENWTDWFEESAGLNHVDINDLAIDPKNPDIIFAGTSGGLYISEDEGESWELKFDGGLYPDSKEIRFVRISANARNSYIGTNNFIFKSSDGGNSWEKKWDGEFSDSLDLVTLDTDPEFLYVGTKKGLYKSFNRGIVWIKDKEMNSEATLSILVSPLNHSMMYLAAESSLFYTRNGGDDWETVGWNPDEIAHKTQLKKLALIPKTKGEIGKPKLIAGTTAGIFISENNGKSWAHPNLVESANATPREDMKMDMVKLMTEIHTGRFFGSYFYLLVDLATLGLIFLIISGAWITLYRSRLAKTKLEKEEIAVDQMLDIQETADDLSQESHQIHDMIEQISEHLGKCKNIYMKKEKKEIEIISKHVVVIDQKMHHLMERIEEFEKLSHD